MALIRSQNPYEVTTEDKVAAANPTPAQISLTDCLACSGCVTSAEAILVSLQSHTEVLNTLDEYPSLDLPWLQTSNGLNGHTNGINGFAKPKGKIFIASVSPQARATLAAAYGITSEEAGHMIEQLLCGPEGLKAGGSNGASFQWVLDTNILRSLALVAASEEVNVLLQDPIRTSTGDGSSIIDKPKKPILTSACPGWICYAEKTHPHILPHLSRLKSPQALAGVLLKSILYKQFHIHPSNVWHLAIMPCFDKKLEASRSELTSTAWFPESADAIRDVDCVITARELISLAASRNINFANLPRSPLSPTLRTPFPDPDLNSFLFPSARRKDLANASASAGTSGGYLWHILRRLQATHPGSEIVVTRGRNADVVEYALTHPGSPTPLVRCARYYGFRNIQNLVRKLKPVRTSRLLAAAGAKAANMRSKPLSSKDNVDYAYVEVMACPGGCTNGGGQIRAGEQDLLRAGEPLDSTPRKAGPVEQKAWLASVDEAYYSAEEDLPSDAMEVDIQGDQSDLVDGICRKEILRVVEHWSMLTGVSHQDLLCTSFRKVESDVGKKKVNDIDRVVGLASSIGGGW